MLPPRGSSLVSRESLKKPYSLEYNSVQAGSTGMTIDHGIEAPHSPEGFEAPIAFLPDGILQGEVSDSSE